jgi:hypothetical protein
MMPAAIIESLSPLTALRRMFLSAAVHSDHYHLYYKCAQQPVTPRPRIPHCHEDCLIPR